MITSTVLAVFFTPVFFLIFQSLSEKLSRKPKWREAMLPKTLSPFRYFVRHAHSSSGGRDELSSRSLSIPTPVGEIGRNFRFLALA